MIFGGEWYDEVFPPSPLLKYRLSHIEHRLFLHQPLNQLLKSCYFIVLGFDLLLNK